VPIKIQSYVEARENTKNRKRYNCKETANTRKLMQITDKRIDKRCERGEDIKDSQKGKSGRQREREENVHVLVSTEKGKDTRSQKRG
jgi:hypothetical protein